MLLVWKRRRWKFLQLEAIAKKAVVVIAKDAADPNAQDTMCKVAQS